MELLPSDEIDPEAVEILGYLFEKAQQEVQPLIR